MYRLRLARMDPKALSPAASPNLLPGPTLSPFWPPPNSPVKCFFRMCFHGAALLAQRHLKSFSGSEFADEELLLPVALAGFTAQLVGHPHPFDPYPQRRVMPSFFYSYSNLTATRARSGQLGQPSHIFVEEPPVSFPGRTTCLRVRQILQKKLGTNLGPLSAEYHAIS